MTLSEAILPGELRMKDRNLEAGRLFLGVVCMILFVGLASAQQIAPHWSYSGHEGPKNWGDLNFSYADCSAGRTQSPINILRTKRADLPAPKFDYNPAPLNIIDNGHTIQVNYPAGSTLTLGDKTFTLRQFHFHHPSEDLVKGHVYNMVVHLVHTDGKGSLAVVAVFLKKGNSSKIIDLIWKNIPKEKDKAVDVSGATINANDLLPAGRGYYTFAGSLTTPPCSEGVTWYVMKNPVGVSKVQVAAFAKLYPHNARPTQPANGREILESQ